MTESKNEKIYFVRIYGGGSTPFLFKNTDYYREDYKLEYVNFFKDKNKAIEEGIKYFKEKWTENCSFKREEGWKEDITENEDYTHVKFMSNKCYLPYSFRVYSADVK